MRLLTPYTGERLRDDARETARVRSSAFAGLDPLLVLALAVLGALGVANLWSLGETSEALHQAASLALGGMAMLLGVRATTRQWRRLGRGIYALALLLLLGVAAAGSHAFGAQRWLALGSLVFQPSELAKLGLLLLLAQILASRPRRPHRLLLALGVAAVPIGLTLLEPDLSTALLLALVAGSMILLARIRFRSLFAIAAAAGLVVPFGLRLLRPYQLVRLESFLHGGASVQGAGWTQLQAHIAVASGGLLGAVTVLPKQLLAQYLPARETDLAFASLVEQHGLVAGAAVLVAGLVLVWRLVAAVTRTRTEVGSLLASGLATLLGGEIAINVAGNLGLLPLAGVPFPLVSFGGTAVVAHCVAAGVVMGERREEGRRRLWCPPRFRRPRPRLARVTAAALALSLLALAASTFNLQRQQGAALQQVALTQATRTIVLPGGRGAIEDRHGTPLALDLPVERVLAVPSVVRAASGADVRLASLLGEPVSAVDRSLASPPPYLGYDVVLADDVPDTVAAAVDRAHVPGVIVAPTVERVYPYGSLLGPLLGFSGVATRDDLKLYGPLPPDEIVGRDGLEQEYDSVLRGSDGSQRLLVDPSGTPVAMGTLTQPGQGGDIRLSIDLGLQQAAAAALAEALRGVGHGQPRGDEGSITVMDARSGQILAMASQPGDDDSAYGPPVDVAKLEAQLGPGMPFLEHATQTVLPPGSTFKLVVAAADLATHVVSPSLVIPTGGSFDLDGTTMLNWSALPPQNLPEAVAWSNDVYFYKLALALGPYRIAQAAQQLGVGQLTGIDLPDEQAGGLATPATIGQDDEQWYPGTTAMLGIGQGPVSTTPLEDARWTAAVATGTLVTPRLMMATRPAGADAFTLAAAPRSQPLSFAADLGPLQQGLRQAVVDGTGTMLASLPQPAAGKTGTAQDSLAPDGGPDAWYTAYSPAGAPQVVVTVSVRGGGEGAWTAEPAAREVLQYFDTHQQQILAIAPLAPASAAGTAAAAPPAAATTAPAPAPAALQVAEPVSELRTLRRSPAG